MNAAPFETFDGKIDEDENMNEPQWNDRENREYRNKQAPPDFSNLDARRIRLATPPPQPIPVFTLCDQHISTSGGLTIVAAQAKAGKTATVGGMLASILAADAEDDSDCFGFQGTPTNGKAVVFFDTEQSPWDAYCLAKRAADRAEINELPENFRGYYLLDIDTRDRRRFLSMELDRAASACGGVHAVLVDGVGDLCLSVNDEEEAIAFVDELIALAVKHSCPLILVLHENPGGGETGKTRGHLGSQLERKAESNLRIVKESDGISTIYSERCRKAHIPKTTGPRFAWNDKAKRHETVTERPTSEKAAAARRELEEDATQVFNCPEATGGLSWADVHGRIEIVCGLKRSGARKKFQKLIDAEILKKNSLGNYHL